MTRYRLFTDAASYNNGKKDPSKPQHSYSAALLVDEDGNLLHSVGSFNPNTTNNYGEIFAIYLGLKESVKYLEENGLPLKIDLYSDSEICVNGLNTWIHNWKKKAVDGIWYGSSGMVSNQEIFKLIDEMRNKPRGKKLFKNMRTHKKYDINIYHVRGHIDVNKSKDVQKAIKTFERVNGFPISHDKLTFIVDMNNKVDKVAVNQLKKYV